MRVPSGGVVGYAVLESDWVMYVVAREGRLSVGLMSGVRVCGGLIM